MKLWRNTQIRRLAFVIALFGGGIILAAWLMDMSLGIACGVAIMAMTVIFGVYLHARHRAIALLTDYLERIDHGDYSLDVRDNEEGELSILKNEIYKVAHRLTEYSEALESEHKLLAQSLSDIAHQIKTPLTGMTVLCDVLANGQLPQEKRLEFIKVLAGQVERLNWLASALLKLSRLDAGIVKFNHEWVEAGELIRRALLPLQVLLEKKHQHIELPDRMDIGFWGDLAWMAEALENIFKNCMEYTPEYGSIFVAVSDAKLYTRICIHDTGPGISPDDLPFLFNRFYKGRSSADDSVGIGLAMAQQIIQMQGGVITVQNGADGGAVFEIKLYHFDY